MARNTVTSAAVAVSQLNEIVSFLSNGTTNPQSRLQFFEGSQPANPSTAAGQTPVFEFQLNEPPCGPITNSNPGAQCSVLGLPKTALALRNTSAGGIAWHRFINRDQVGSVDGSTGTNPSAFDIYANVTLFTTGQQLELQVLTLRMKQGPAG